MQSQSGSTQPGLIIRVATTGDPSIGPIAGDPSGEEMLTPFEDLPYVSLSVDAEAALGEVVRQGARMHGFPTDFTPPYVEFFSLETQQHRTGLLGSLVLIDNAGRATFNNYWVDVRMADAVTAHKAGALLGDPTRIVLVPNYGFGNGFPVDWATAQVVFDHTLQVLDHVAAAYGAYEFVARIARIFRRRKRIDEQHQTSWRSRGALPADVHQFIKSRTNWEAEHLASLLGCSQDNAEAYLSGKGFEWDGEAGLWRQPSSAESETALVSSLDELMLWVDMTDNDINEALRRNIERMIEQYIRTGQAPAPIDLYIEGEDGGLP